MEQVGSAVEHPHHGLRDEKGASVWPWVGLVSGERGGVPASAASGIRGASGIWGPRVVLRAPMSPLNTRII